MPITTENSGGVMFPKITANRTKKKKHQSYTKIQISRADAGIFAYMLMSITNGSLTFF